MEAAILRDPIFEQVMIVGEGRSYLSALTVLSKRGWEVVATHCNAKMIPMHWRATSMRKKSFWRKLRARSADFPAMPRFTVHY